MKQYHFIKHSCLRGFFLVCFYTLFFSVELLHNFDNDKAQISYPVADSPIAQWLHHTQIVKSNKPHEQGKTNFRLNKRFQPSFLPSAFIFTAKPFAEHVGHNYTGGYCNESLFDIFLLTQSLRAPPVV